MNKLAATATAMNATEYVYSDTTDMTDGARKRICEDIIYSQDPTDLPLRDYVGGYNKLNVESVQIQHIEDNHMAINTTIGTAATGWNTGSDASALSVTDGDVIMVGDILLTADGEIVVVSAVSESGNTIDVYGRGDLGSTESNAHSDGDAIYIIGNAQLEGFTYGADPRFMTRAAKSNYTAIFEDTLGVSKSYEEVPKYGIKSEVAHQLRMKQLRICKLLERSVLYSGANTGTLEGTAAQPRTMCGMIGPGTGTIDIQTVTSNVSGVEVTEADIKADMQAIFDNGGKVDTIIVNSFNKGVISDWMMPYRRTDFEDKRYGGIVTKFDSDFGTCSIILDRYMRQSDIILFNKANFSIGALRPFKIVTLPDDRDMIRKSIIGEYTCMLHNEEHAAWLYNTATS